MRTIISNLFYILGGVGAAVIFNYSFASAAGNDTQKADRVVVVTGVIFPTAIALRGGVCTSVKKCWTPSRHNIEILERAFPTFLLSERKWGAKEISRNLELYKRKYYGYRVGLSDFIHVNGLCNKYWRPNGADFYSPKRPLTDMGSCYFTVDYNVERQRFENFYVDGDG